jgi:hypothetical protein
MQTFLNTTHGTTAGHTRSTSNGYYTSLSPDFIRALSPEDLRQESCEQELEKRVLLPQLRQARGIQFKTPNSVHDKVLEFPCVARVLVPAHEGGWGMERGWGAGEEKTLRKRPTPVQPTAENKSKS